ncbi:MAG TPA: glycosyl transferase family 36 [bacterium]|nr:glycosyl transferase family 36 [bacterium]
MKFETKYGYFSDDGNEYIIKDYNTPRPWVNVMSNGEYGLVVSQLNGGFSWLIHSNLNRLTRWQQDLIRDDWGKYIFLRDNCSGEYWSPTLKPVMKKLDMFQCTHGIGYTKFYSVFKNIEIQFRIFVPFEHNLEIWSLNIKNLANETRRLSIFTYLEWCLGVAPDTHREFHKSFLETDFDEANQALFARKRLWELPSKRGHWNRSWDYVAFLACNESLDGFESDKEQFIGRYHGLDSPLALKTGELHQTQGKWNDAIGSLKKNIQLKPYQNKAIHFFLGAVKKKQEADSILNKYRDNEAIEVSFANMNNIWKGYLDKTTIETPDEALNILTNSWLKYQTISGRLWGRAAYYQQSGAYGFRDQLQDSQIFLSINPALTKQRIIEHAKHQFQLGNVVHWWHPITEQGHDGNMTDDLLWLSFITIQYLKETANWDFLNEKVAFYDSSKTATILEHCLRAIDLTLSRFSKRGLPLILAGDWNDGLSAVGLDQKGESIWLAHFLYYILSSMILPLEKQGQTHKIKEYQQRASELKKAINEYGWDGKWFWRASKDNGDLIGSHKNKQGQIFLNAQVWAIIAQSTSAERQQKIIEQIEAQLECDYGMLLFTPAYNRPDPELGYLSRYAPGVRENGGIYTHAAIWALWAECLLKRFDAAYRLYQKISPILNSQHPDSYCAEPYVTPGNIEGPASAHYGRGGWTWYTGSAAWLFRVTVDYLIGIRADYDGLIIDPQLPKSWNEMKINRHFRGADYLIHISRAADGVKKILSDDIEIQGNLVKPGTYNSTIKIQVEV